LGNAIKSIDNENLYVLPWNASFYHDGGLHDLLVEIRDNQNNKIQNENQFSLATTTMTAWTRSKFILFIHWPSFVKKKFFCKNLFRMPGDFFREWFH
jgi:hypothetical protein